MEGIKFKTIRKIYFRLLSLGYSDYSSYDSGWRATVSGDSYENDNSYASANIINVGGSYAQTHSIYPSGDEDWVKFYAYSGNTYTIETFTAGGTDVDTVIELYNSSITFITSDDDNGEGRFSKITSWSCTSTGYYYVKISGYGGSSTGDYKIKVYQP